MSTRYETRDSPITNYIWVTWDTEANWFVYGSRDRADVDDNTARMNAADDLPTPATEDK